MLISKRAKWLNRTMKQMNLKEKSNYYEPKWRRPFTIPVPLALKYQVKEWAILGSRVVHIKKVTQNYERIVIYLHGGAYANGVNLFQFSLLDDLSEQLEAECFLIDYPLAPENTVKKTMVVCLRAYEKIVKRYPDKAIVIVGDSAGGGLALALAIQLKERDVKQPEKLVLFSPWLDIGLNHPDIQKYADKDYVLNMHALRTIGKTYAGDLDIKDPMVSPLFGDLNHLGDIAIFYGTEELLFPDCHDFAKLKDLEGTTITAYPYIGMQHDWIMTPVLERELSLKETQRFIMKERFEAL